MPPIEPCAKVIMPEVSYVIFSPTVRKFETVLKCLCILKSMECNDSTPQMTSLVIENIHKLWIENLHTRPAGIESDTWPPPSQQSQELKKSFQTFGHLFVC
jgi:hypothetical protein